MRHRRTCCPEEAQTRRINLDRNCQFDCFNLLTVTHAHGRFLDSVHRYDKILVLVGDVFNGHWRLSGSAED